MAEGKLADSSGREIVLDQLRERPRDGRGMLSPRRRPGGWSALALPWWTVGELAGLPESLYCFLGGEKTRRLRGADRSTRLDRHCDRIRGGVIWRLGASRSSGGSRSASGNSATRPTSGTRATRFGRGKRTGPRLTGAQGLPARSVPAMTSTAACRVARGADRQSRPGPDARAGEWVRHHAGADPSMGRPFPSTVGSLADGIVRACPRTLGAI